MINRIKKLIINRKWNSSEFQKEVVFTASCYTWKANLKICEGVDKNGEQFAIYLNAEKELYIAQEGGFIYPLNAVNQDWFIVL